MFLVKITTVITFLLTTVLLPVTAHPYVAFSLREAENLAQLDKKMGHDLVSLGGITRVVAMVHDQEGEDVILVGRVVEGQPKASFDDLVVALRARIRYDEWPLVSIDPTEETPITNQQVVRFMGGIAETSFGETFLDCDIILKKYGLGLLESLSDVPSYKAFYVDSIREKIEAEGKHVIQVLWLPPDFFKKFQGQNVLETENNLVRFWFYPLEPYLFVYDDGVFCINELRLCVLAQIVQGSAKGNTKAAELFPKMFTEHFYEITSVYPLLKKLKILYDLVAIAEGIRTLDVRPDFNFLLKEYGISPVETDNNCKLIVECAQIKRSDGLDHIIQISGGIEFKTELEWLNEGDVSPLKTIVLNSRPSPNALLWTLPLEDWEMPNSEGLELKGDREKESSIHPTKMQSEKKGSSLFAQSFILGSAGAKHSTNLKKFTGFSFPTTSPPLAIAPPRGKTLGGIEINPQLYKSGKGGAETRDEVLESRPEEDSLSWTFELPEEVE